MKAIIWTKYGSPDGLQLGEVDMPTPRDHEVLVKIHASSVTAGDCEMRRLELPLMLSFPVRLYAGFLKPKRIAILGQELAGEVVEVGKGVTSYKIGDQVFGTTGFKFGAYTEYICLPERPDDAQGTLALKPENLTYEEAAVVPTAGFEALHFLRKANIQPGKKVLIVGAGGSIGTFAIQLARQLGAEVTGVDSPEKLELIRSLGADHVIDHTKGDYTSISETYDLIIDVVGKGSVGRRLKLLKEGGYYFLAYAGLSHILLSMWTSMTSNKRLKIESSAQKKDDLIFLKELLEAGKLKSVIDRSYSLEKTAEAHRYVESGNKKGNVALTVL
ncbi:MAG: NAD(P)-dependent alcohol dehydrogenase [Anaerolineales bacterium]|nr:NAD(P)-dependent alcohol dehydrogenase [Anaerolineae bacterium]PWB71078.1 MAG: NAD(P)-dependent alcohol dehydrogenase [Anaerolineales bacterium]